MFKLPDLPYDFDALEPHISARTMHFHYEKHHSGYVDKLNDALGDIDFDYSSVEEIIKKSIDRNDLTNVYNNAAQVWNHTFFWNCMKPGGGGEPQGELQNAIEVDFGSLSKFRDTFVATASGRFGSGYVWLVKQDGALAIRDTANADPAFITGDVALLCCDVWEHAYYLDYQNGRAEFVETFLDQLVDWDFVSVQMTGDADQPSICPAR